MDLCCVVEMTRVKFQAFWDQEKSFDSAERVFRLMAQPGATTLVPSDFLPFLNSLMMNHPDLSILPGQPDIQEKYGTTCWRVGECEQ